MLVIKVKEVSQLRRLEHGGAGTQVQTQQAGSDKKGLLGVDGGEGQKPEHQSGSSNREQNPKHPESMNSCHKATHNTWTDSMTNKAQVRLLRAGSGNHHGGKTAKTGRTTQ